MNVVLVVHMFMPESNSGTETLTFAIASGLNQLGYSITVITAGKMDESGKRVKKYKYFGLDVVRIAYCKGGSYNPIASDIGDHQMLSSFEVELVNIKPDVILFTHLKYFSASAISISKKYSKQVFLYLTDFWYICPITTLFKKGSLSICDPSSVIGSDCMRCMYPYPYGGSLFESLSRHIKDKVSIYPFNMYRQIFIRRNLILANLKLLDAIFYPTDIVISWLNSTEFGSTKFIKLPFGIDGRKNKVVEKIRTTTCNKLHICFIGTMIYEKGPDLFIKAVNDLDESVRRVCKFSMYGSLDNLNPYHCSLIASSIESGSNIDFCGTFPPEVFDDVMSGVDLIVVPSRWHENSPLVLIKAIKLGVFALVADNEGLLDAKKYTNRIRQFSSGDHSSLNYVINDLIQSGILSEKLESQECTIPSTIEMVKVIESLIITGNG